MLVIKFPLKTRMPKDSNIMVFSGDNSVKLADIFMRGKHRFATMDEVLTLRMQSTNPESSIWGMGCTCEDREYFGLNKDNIPIIVVLHDVPDFLKSSAEPTISHDLFLEIAEGKHGPVNTVTFETVLTQYNKKESRFGYFKYEEALENELLLARLGSQGKEYIKHQYNIITKDGTVNLHSIHEFMKININSYYQDADCRCALYENGVGLVVHLSGILDATKGNTVALQSRVRIDGLVNAWTTCEVTTTSSLSGSWAICNDEPLYYKDHIPFYSTGHYKDNLPVLFTGHTESITFTECHLPIEKRFQVWYVCNAQGHPQFMVRSLEIVGLCTIGIKSTVLQARASELPTLTEIEKAMKQPWDFYRIVNQKHRKGNNSIVDFLVEYFRGDVYIDRIIPNEEQIVADYNLLGRIV